MEPTQIRADGFYYDLGKYIEGHSRRNRLELLVSCSGFNVKDGLVTHSLRKSKERSGYFGGGFFRGYFFIIEEATEKDPSYISTLRRCCHDLT